MLDRVRELRLLGLSDLRSLERPGGAGERVELATGRAERQRLVAVVVSPRGGVELVGWAYVAAALAPEAVSEALIVAPSFDGRTRRAAARLVGRGLPLRLAAVPALAGEGDEVHNVESFPVGRDRGLPGTPTTTLLDRVVRVVEGAALVTDAAGVRRTSAGYVLYVRGAVAARIAPDGDGVAVAFLEPERRTLRIQEDDFPRFGVELQEQVLQLAQDPRLLEGSARDRAVEQAVGEAGARLTGRWLPWNDSGSDPLDWVGVGEDGRPVLGWVRPALRLSDVPALVAAQEIVEEERDAWAPASRGEARLLFYGEEMEPAAREVLARLGLHPEVQTPLPGGVAPLEPPPERERRGRRRGRRRRRGRGEGGGWRGAEAEGGREDESEEREPGEEEPEFEPEEAEFGEPGEEPEADDETERAYGAAPDREGGEEEYAERERWTPAPRVPEDAGAPEPEVERAAFGPEHEARGEEEGAEPREDESVSAEIEATLAEGEGEEAGEPGLVLEEEPPRRPRRARTAIVVRDDPDTILAGLVLARERRTVILFRVCPQEGLMDFFRTGGTDLDENVDLLLVGFTAQPVPAEIIQTAALYRGRLQWFDHQEWPIEDLERLREAIGRDAIVFASQAPSSLAAVLQIAERRSRFTDKLVDLSARRLSENDMERWGYRLVALLQRLARQPGEHRSAIQPVLAGKPTDLPSAGDVYAEEEKWLANHQPRLVYFGDYALAVSHVPEALDPGEVGRRLRLQTGARMSLVTRAGDDLAFLGCSEEKHQIHVLGMVDHLAAKLPWASARPTGDRAGRLRIEDLPRHPERLEAVIGEIVRHKSILYG